MNSSSKLGEAIYKNSPNNSSEQSQNTQSNNEDSKVVDAEYQEIKDKKEGN
jgi:molecular chaperone DnaK